MNQPPECCLECKAYLESMGLTLEMCQVLCEVRKRGRDAEVKFLPTGIKVLEIRKSKVYDGTTKQP